MIESATHLAVTSVFLTIEEAREEVERLNALNGAKGVEYFLYATRLIEGYATPSA